MWGEVKERERERDYMLVGKWLGASVQVYGCVGRGSRENERGRKREIDRSVVGTQKEIQVE